MNCILCNAELPIDGICIRCVIPDVFLYKGEEDMICIVCGKGDNSSLVNGVCPKCKNNPDKNEGWICPKCKTSLSPNVVSCPFCKPSTKTEGGMTFEGKTILMEGN